jgi:CRP-like cAMP-binding protein
MPREDRDGALSCTNCPVWKKSLFANLPARDIDHLDGVKTMLRFEKGDHIFEQGAPATGIFCIQSGVAKILQKNVKGNGCIVRIAPPGDTVGHRSIFTRTEFRGSAQATGALSACRVPKAALLHFLGTNPDFAQHIVMKMARDIETSEREQLTLYGKNVRERLADLMLKLRDACGERQPDGSWKLAVHITRGDIASMLGTAYETAIRFMTEFKQDGILRQEDETIFITDLSKLLATAGD